MASQPLFTRRIVQRIPGPQTTAGEGDILIDEYGQHYRQVSAAEASILRQGTGNVVYTLYQNGTIG
jgi:hypothetical protein